MHDAPTTTTRAGAKYSRLDWRSTNDAPFAFPLFLSTLISRTTALGMMVSLPVASASGSNRFTELASVPVATRSFVVGTLSRLADSMKRCTLRLSRELSSRKMPSGSCGNPSLRPETRKSGSTRS